MICVDTTFLSLFIHPESSAPKDPKTNRPIERLLDRLELVRKNWDADREEILIPTPVLCEFLILAKDAGPAYLDKIHKTSNFKVKSFDEMAAIELAAVQVSIMSGQGKRAQKRDDASGTWAKIKFDRQIIAIAKTHAATAIYTDDENLRAFAKRLGIEPISTWELPLPQPTLLDDIPGEDY